MAIPFGTNLSQSFAYTNTAIKSFTGWFGVILLYLLLVVGSVISVVALLALIGLVMTIAIPPNGVLFTEAGVSQVIPTDIMSTINPETMGLALGFSGLLLIVGLIVTIVLSLLFHGYTLRVYRGDELNLKHPFKMFGQGIALVIIQLIYFIPYLVVSTVVMFGPIENTAYMIIVGIIIPTLLCVVTVILAMNAGIRYAKNGFGAAFQVGKIAKIVGNIGWLRYLGHSILFTIIVGVIELIFVIVPIVGIPMLIVAGPFILIFSSKFFANLYESGEVAKVASVDNGEAPVVVVE